MHKYNTSFVQIKQYKNSEGSCTICTYRRDLQCRVWWWILSRASGHASLALVILDSLKDSFHLGDLSKYPRSICRHPTIALILHCQLHHIWPCHLSSRYFPMPSRHITQLKHVKNYLTGASKETCSWQPSLWSRSSHWSSMIKPLGFKLKLGNEERSVPWFN